MSLISGNVRDMADLVGAPSGLPRERPSASRDVFEAPEGRNWSLNLK